MLVILILQKFYPVIEDFFNNSLQCSFKTTIPNQSFHSSSMISTNKSATVPFLAVPADKAAKVCSALLGISKRRFQSAFS